MRIIYMGTPEFAVPALQVLHNKGYEVVAVYSQPPRPKNRGQHLTKGPVHLCAEALSIPVFTPTSLKTPEAQAIFKEHKADLAVVAAYGLILPQAILDIPSLGCINIHGSLLPIWRGAAPIHRAMLAGDSVTGITLMKMDAGLDTGYMLAKRTYPLSLNMTFAHVHDDLARMGADLLVEMLPEYILGHIQGEVQSNDFATYAHKLKKEENVLDFSQNAPDLVRRIHTLNPWPGTTMMYKDIPLKILAAEVAEVKMEELGVELSVELDLTHFPPPGTWLDGGKIVCGGGTIIQISVLQRPGGKPMSISAFLRGLHKE